VLIASIEEKFRQTLAIQKLIDEFHA